MEDIQLGLRYLLPAIAVASVARAIYINRRQIGFLPLVWKRFRPGMLVEVLVLLAATLAIIFLLYAYVPPLRWGWPSLLDIESGNIAISPVTEGSESSHLFVRLLVPLFLLALLITLPLFAAAEERIFRKGRLAWGEIAASSTLFGLAHLIVGVPLAAALALILPGLFYAYKYRRAYLILKDHLTEDEAQRGGWLVATTYHTLYNTLLVGSLLVITVMNI